MNWRRLHSAGGPRLACPSGGAAPAVIDWSGPARRKLILTAPSHADSRGGPRIDVFPKGEAAVGSQLIQFGAEHGVVAAEPQCIVEHGQRGRVGVLRGRADRYRVKVGPDVRPLRHAAIVSQLEQLK